MVIYKFQNIQKSNETFRSHSFCGINEEFISNMLMKGGIH